MIDIKLIRENPELVKKNSKNRDYDPKVVDDVLKLDKKWRKMKNQDDKFRAERNKVSKEINQAKKEKKDFKTLIKKAKEIADKIRDNEEKENELRKKIDSLVAIIPNIQVKEAPIGGEKDFKFVSKWGKISKSAKPKTHLVLGKELDIIDMPRGAKIAGSGFYLLKGGGARLQRALVQFMLDFHNKNNFIEINPPHVVNRQTAFGTGNLPKFENDLYWTKNKELSLIPTAEVPVTNLHAGEILKEKELPKKYCSFTQCYRIEAGRHAGEEGLFRLHQFEKVEMVYVCKPEDSWDFLEEMTEYAEKIIKELELPYRKIILATADAGFASAKTYDLEVWAPGMNRYLEISSCTNCLDFQARRMNCRYQSKDGLKFVHTLNGSGLALPRLVIAIMENNQQKDGSIKVPKALWKYTGFKEIKKKK